MQLIGVLTLDEFKKKHADSRAPLNTWQAFVKAAEWNGPQDIKNIFPSASFLPNNLVIFNIKGNAYRLVVRARYQNNRLLVEWIGTHAQYSKKKFEGDNK